MAPGGLAELLASLPQEIVVLVVQALRNSIARFHEVEVLAVIAIGRNQFIWFSVEQRVMVALELYLHPVIGIAK
ncbi:hypothetical protein HAX54_026335 [Datura stramonium]|uniref:Uncharacterized protein n=1 Tax=Datura stramonium TaxID=4076 RepID=A0ABS8RK81_DATST|nr:hypothetical protein [Datura stramonium]